MPTKRFALSLLPLVAVLAFSSQTLFAQSKLDFQPNDTIRTILERQAGQVVELRMTSGEKIAGKVEKVNEELVHLSNLTGAEFYEAAVDLTAINAVVIRAKSK
jgi:hypothetical protein